MLYFFIKTLPLSLLSRLFGIFSRTKFPKQLQLLILKIYSGIYKLNLDEAQKNITEYKSLNEFFIRSLKKEIRPIPKEKNLVISPVDGRLVTCSKIKKNILIQAKNYFYTVEELIQNEILSKKFIDGYYFLFYLSPKDCHRIFTPTNIKKIISTNYIKGKSFPVNEWALFNINKLFVRNERIVSLLETDNKKSCAMVMVGATNVSSIHLNYDSEIYSNKWFRKSETKYYNEKISYKCGDEIGYFSMGSTVILLFEKNSFTPEKNLIFPKQFKYGEKIGKLN